VSARALRYFSAMPKVARQRRFLPRRCKTELLNPESVFDILIRQGYCTFLLALKLYNTSKTLRPFYDQFYIGFRKSSKLFFVDNTWPLLMDCFRNPLRPKREGEFTIAEVLIVRDHVDLAWQWILAAHLNPVHLAYAIGKNGRLKNLTACRKLITPLERTVLLSELRTNRISPLYSSEVLEEIQMWEFAVAGEGYAYQFFKKMIHDRSEEGLKYCVSKLIDSRLPSIKHWRRQLGLDLLELCRSRWNDPTFEAILYPILQH